MPQNKLFCARAIPGAPFVRSSVKKTKLSDMQQVKVGKTILLVKDGYPQMLLVAPKRKGDYQAKCPFHMKPIHIDSDHQLDGFRGRSRRSRRR